MESMGWAAWSFFGPPKSKKPVLHILLHGCNIHANSTYNLYSLLPIHAHLTGVISVGFIGINKKQLISLRPKNAAISDMDLPRL